MDQKKKREESQTQQKKRPRDEKEEKKKKKVKQQVGPSPIIPSNILFVENIPDQIVEESKKVLEMLFIK